MNNIQGRRFGRLMASEFTGVKKNGAAIWLCRCDCGCVKEINIYKLLNGNTQSCGCLRRELVTKKNYRHGLDGGPEHRSWQMMLSRCRNPKFPKYYAYGARGISVCDRWLSFKNFFADMGPRASGTTLERIDNFGNYEPTNCKWSGAQEQQRNKRTNHLVTYGGFTRCLAEWSEITGINRATLWTRLMAGWSPERALRP